MTDMEKWLGAEFGRDGAKPLRAEMYKNFLIGAAADVWTLDDVPDASKEGTLDGPEMARCVKFMSTILTECHKARGSTDPPSSVKLARLEDWLAGRYAFVDVSLATASKAAAAAMSAECQADLASQGMTDLNTLLFVELSKELGRPVGAWETEGGAYRSPPTIIDHEGRNRGEEGRARRLVPDLHFGHSVREGERGFEGAGGMDHAAGNEAAVTLASLHGYLRDALAGSLAERADEATSPARDYQVLC